MRLLFIFILMICSSVMGATTHFSFDNSFQEWGSWGDGTGVIDSNIGHAKKGSIYLSTDWGETQTVHYRWNDLKPGKYKITAYVRGLDVQKHPEGMSFWHFFDRGNDTENVFTELNGSYDWRKIEYSIDIPKSTLSIWFRLKSPAQVWIDDFELTPTESVRKLVIADPVRFIPVKISQKKKQSLKKEVMLLDFDKTKTVGPFPVNASHSGNKMGQLESKKYYNFTPKELQNGNWSGFSRIEFDLYNGSNVIPELYFSLGDAQSSNYWAQLNHKTHLSPGWNHLSFSLSQFLGERGSHRFHRSIDLKNIKKMFIIVDPNEKLKSSSKYFFDNLKIVNSPPPVVPKGVWAFDFTSHKDFQNSGLTKVTSQSLFDEKRGFGFVTPKYWRVEDAQWAPHTMRYSIGVLSGKFKVKLPNGSYKMQLLAERLGYWDVSFWQNRMIYLNDKPVFKESRSFAKDFLTDWLQFSETVPEESDHAYDLYLKKIFKPLEFSFTVKNGEATLAFDADPTGISLNSLVIWNVFDEAAARAYLKKNIQRAKDEFDWIARSIKSEKLKSNSLKLATLIEPSLTLGPEGEKPSKVQDLKLVMAQGESSHQFIQLRGEGSVSWSLSELTSKSGAKFQSSDVNFSKVIQQYVSPDLNHETYMIAGKYLSDQPNKRLALKKNSSVYISMAVATNAESFPGDYEGTLTFTQGKKREKISINLHVLASELPKVDFPLGFFGPDPISFNYFQSSDMEAVRKKYRHEALRILGASGFTTFSGLPEAKLKKLDDSWMMDTTAIDETMTAANRAGMSKVYFSYSGHFPQKILSEYFTQAPADQKAISSVLSKYLMRPGMPKVVHTFSDEASGYSDRVAQDVTLGREIKEKLPFMSLGGFSSLSETSTSELRSLFDYGFYSNVSKTQLNMFSGKDKWGSYNASPGNLDDPSYTMGPGLFYARGKGLSYYLEWHASAVNNYPYYDLDGRESDVTMFMPSLSGKLNPTIRYILAVKGLNSFRKLILLDQAVSSKKGSEKNRELAKSWLLRIKKGEWSQFDNILRPVDNFSFTHFEAELNEHLHRLLAL
jgi:hypothetical protein